MMQRINEIVSRIQTIQAQVERPPVAGAFQSLLDTRMSSTNERNALDDIEHANSEHGAHQILAAPAALTAFNTRGRVTLGTMMAGPQSVSSISAAGPNNGVAGSYFPTHHVADGQIMTSQELRDYMATHSIEARNGRLRPDELTGVSGSWHGNGKLLEPAAEAWEIMRAAAAKDGVELKAIDTYRTWESQERAHKAHLAGEKKANVLPPGTSRHGAGLAVDVTNGHIVNRNDPEWQWLDANGRSFGWHPISNETWHWEFRGV
ncbi:MAG: M15 family metallopeptidase [Acidimicrobiia bacterium]